MKSSESAFQALLSPDHIDEYVPLDGFAAKKLSKIHARGADRSNTAIDAMTYVLRCKFTQNPELASKLMALDGDIVEYNEWYDTFWGVCNGVGENHLGKCLMEIRDELQANANCAKNKKSVAICGTAGFDNSNKIAKLSPDVKNYIMNKLASYPILIGDCPSGIDKLAQDTLKECNAKDVTVYFIIKKSSLHC